MSRSKKNTPIVGITTADTEKGSKRKANRKFRRISKEKIKKGEIPLIDLNEISNVWSFDKDGKRYLATPTNKDLRK